MDGWIEREQERRGDGDGERTKTRSNWMYVRKKRDLNKEQKNMR